MNILTFDIEEWYIYELYPKGGKEYYLPILNAYLSKLLDLLDERAIQATFFCLGAVGRSHPAVIKQIFARGHEIGCHSDQHVLIHQMTPAQFRKDTASAVDSLQNLIGEKIDKYRAPAFSIIEKSRWALEILIENGIKYDCSLFPVKRGQGALPLYPINGPSILKTASGNLYEFPVSYSRIGGRDLVFSGGGYFRIYPYPAIHYLTSRGDYNMSYFHLRDFDRFQKRVISFHYFQSYYGVKGAWEKFEKFMRDFNFISVNKAAALVDWEKTRIIAL